MKKAVLYIGNFLFPNGNASGKRVFGNALIFRDLGYKVFCFGFNKTDKVQEYLSYEDIVYCSIPYVNGIKRLNIIKPYTRFLSIIHEIETQGYTISSIVMYGSLASTKLNIKIIKWGNRNNVAVYYDHVDIFPTPQKKPFARYIMKLYENQQLNKKVFRKCDGIICISSYLSKLHSDYTKTVVIPPVVRENIQAIKRDDGIIRIVYAGTVSDNNRPLSEWKDRIDLIVDSAYEIAQEGIENIRFDFVGFTDLEFIDMLPLELKDSFKIKLKAIEKIAVFHGFIPSNETKKIIRHSDFSVLLRDDKITTRAGFPTKVSESISCGIPVITNQTSDIADYVYTGKNGFLIGKNELTSMLKRVSAMKMEKINDMKDNSYNTPSFVYSKYIVVMRKFLDKEIITK